MHTESREPRVMTAGKAVNFGCDGDPAQAMRPMFNLKVTGRTFHEEARVIFNGANGDPACGAGAHVQVNAEQLWSAEELRRVAAMLRIRSETHGSVRSATEARARPGRPPFTPLDKI